MEEREAGGGGEEVGAEIGMEAVMGSENAKNAPMDDQYSEIDGREQQNDNHQAIEIRKSGVSGQQESDDFHAQNYNTNDFEAISPHDMESNDENKIPGLQEPQIAASAPREQVDSPAADDDYEQDFTDDVVE